MRTFRVSSNSTKEPVTLGEVKEFLKVQTTLDDRLLEGLIRASRTRCENYLKRALIPTSFSITMDIFRNNIVLPRPPLSTLSSLVVITFIDTTGTVSTCDSTRYTVDPYSEPGRIYLAYDSEWPDNVRDTENAITIGYKSGYTTANVPEPIKTWLMMDVQDRYEYRGSINESRLNYLDRSFKNGLLDEFEILEIASHS